MNRLKARIEASVKLIPFDAYDTFLTTDAA